MAPTGEQQKAVAITTPLSAPARFESKPTRNESFMHRLWIDPRIDERRRRLGVLFVAVGSALMVAGGWFALVAS